MAFASTDDVTTYTGVTATDAQIEMAQGIVELYCNRSEAASAHFTAKDTRVLKQATCYQVAFMLSNNVFTVGDLSGLSQGDLSVTWKEQGSSDSKTIAPLAAKALKQLSWNRTRSVLTTTDFAAFEADDLEEDGYYVEWQEF